MTQAVGALCLVAGALYLGFLFSRVQNERQARLECFLQLFRFIETEISCYQTPLADIYARFEGEALDKCGFLSCLREKGMAEALVLCRASLTLSDEEYALLADFAGELGKSYRDEQLRGCEYYRRLLEKYCDEGRRALPARLKLCRSLSLSGGLLAVIILL